MKILLRLFSLTILIALIGCDTQFGNEGAELVPQVKVSKTEEAPPSPQPVTTFVTLKSSINEQDRVWVDQAPAARSEKLAPDEKFPSFDRYLTLNSKLYLSKGGELMGDLTIENNNVVSVNHITVHCVEYNMNQTSIREASMTLTKTLQVGQSSYWDQVNFGYVHNDFETVKCRITKALLA